MARFIDYDESLHVAEGLMLTAPLMSGVVHATMHLRYKSVIRSVNLGNIPLLNFSARL